MPQPLRLLMTCADYPRGPRYCQNKISSKVYLILGMKTLLFWNYDKECLHDLFGETLATTTSLTLGITTVLCLCIVEADSTDHALELFLGAPYWGCKLFDPLDLAQKRYSFFFGFHCWAGEKFHHSLIAQWQYEAGARKTKSRLAVL